MEEIKPQSNNPLTRDSIAQQTAADLLANERPCLQTDFICLSHLRWDFVYQRPQHLLSRFGKHRRVFYVEEPVIEDIDVASMHITPRTDHVRVVVPHLPRGLSEEEALEAQRRLLDEMIEEHELDNYTLWYYTPMALNFTRHLNPQRVIYDCMDELSLFKGAPQSLLDLERELFAFADHVFTGGHSLFESKKSRHPSVHAFPSSIDHAHFMQARTKGPEPEDQKHIPHPRVGFFGVIDERADLELIEGAARLRPDWQFVMIGPVVKIDPSKLPQLPNIHFLGMKSYSELPAYLAHWDLAMLPFALNEATRFISPTKTPEYLAAGKPVVSTAIRDVIRPYAEEGLVHIVSTPQEFIIEGELAMREKAKDPQWLNRIDQFLSNTSWEKTWNRMAHLERSIDCMTVKISEVPTSALH